MRCRPGDLAFIVRTATRDGDGAPLIDLIGRPVRVTEPVSISIGAGLVLPGWLLQERVYLVLRSACVTADGVAFAAGERGWIDRYPDAWLQPCRDQPGTDEQLQLARLKAAWRSRFARAAEWPCPTSPQESQQ